ncbi:DUF3108 domain-containing protein [Deinococcus cellulosilyticus]|uniref:Uncharacterized protein n=1 Tax=Deinococcus cellulosilyticus (strain DSM 18568 / NBRC 106333 / KACC 11606 / 5516J-15) TaxID=1223518 RepID=A0A511MXQ1_DEIC1|nr:DUF3108 domain-containing protein [Deinococcus cellulosilyticus]GEM45364.1 hypothetical protein DC3_09990 [Deinococcus cellulosilyticus NBRC 106333 = KACC 11606]
MQAEELQYQLVVGNKAIGEQKLKIEAERNYWVIKAQTSYSHHLLGSGRREQVSRVRPKSRTSAYYHESSENGGRKGSTFETVFDRKTGLVTVRQGKDEASIPMTQDYQDPLSLIQMLRELPDDAHAITVPMVGASVHIQRLPDQVISTLEGEKMTRVYYLRPGLSKVYIEMEPPFRPFKLTQPVDGGSMDMVLVRTPERRRPERNDRSDRQERPERREREPRAEQQREGREAQKDTAREVRDARNPRSELVISKTQNNMRKPRSRRK